MWVLYIFMNILGFDFASHKSLVLTVKGESGDTKILHAFNSILLFTSWYYYLSDHVSFKTL